MPTKRTVSIQRWFALLLFIIYDIIQIYLVGHLKIEPNERLIFRYQIGWVEEFQFSDLTIIALFLIPFLLSYFTAISSVGGQMVQILGPNSLMRRMKMEFHAGNPERRELTELEVETFLSDMAKDEPEGTLENLKMLFNLGITVEKLLETAGTKSVKRVYVSDDLTPNAFTLRVIPLPFIGQDWIIINRNVVDILDINEIRAVIAHEIGHAVRRDSWINSLLYSPRLVIIFGWSIMLANMAGIILNNPFTLSSFLRIVTLLVVFGLVRYLMNIGHRMTALAYRMTELLADYYAARLVGTEELINALIKIGSRGEVIRSINTELQWLDKTTGDMQLEHMAMQIMSYMDPGETRKEIAQTYAIEFYVRAKLNQIFQGFQINISDTDFNQYVEEAKNNLIDRRILVRKHGMTNINGRQETTDWRTVDRDHNEHLDREEIELLVTNLRKDDKKIFESEVMEKMGLMPHLRTHPQVSQRIFFLYDNIMTKMQ